MSLFRYKMFNFNPTPEEHHDCKHSEICLRIATKKWKTVVGCLRAMIFSRHTYWVIWVIFAKIVVHLTRMECQVLACCTQEIESRYLWNQSLCPNGHFMQNQPNYCFQSPQEKYLTYIYFLLWLIPIMWFYVIYDI